jgi:diguanylate cyclase (GGDEF)-like protein
VVIGGDARSNAVHDEDSERPDDVVDDRDRTADDRDLTSQAQDKVSAERDERAEERDERAEVREAASDRFEPGAASDRAGAKRDRQSGAIDRRHAEYDREAASAERALSAHERAAFLVDELTGAHRRDAGMLELERDLARAKRTSQPFVLAFIDVDGLKATNDSLGHGAGDQLLCAAVEAIRGRFRSYDLVVRYGGDEFLCGLTDLSMEEVAERFALVNADLAAARQASVTTGLAELRGRDRLENLVTRADEAMYAKREQRTAGFRASIGPAHGDAIDLTRG